MPEVDRHFSLDENILPSTSKKCSENDDLLKTLQNYTSEDNLSADADVPESSQNFLNLFEDLDEDQENLASVKLKNKKIKAPNKKEKKARCNECHKVLDPIIVGCLRCQRFYLCRDCPVTDRHKNHPLVFHKWPLNQKDHYIHMLLALQTFRKTCRFSKLTGTGFVCDGCGVNVDCERYCCIEIDNYDYCKTCLDNQDEARWKETKGFVKIVPESNDKEMVYEFDRLLRLVTKKFKTYKGFLNGTKLDTIKEKDLDPAKSKIEQLENDVEILLKCLKIEISWVCELQSRCNNLLEHREPEKPKEPIKPPEPVDEPKKTRTLSELGLDENYADENDEDTEQSYDDQIRDEILIINNERKRILYLENQLNLYKQKYGDL